MGIYSERLENSSISIPISFSSLDLATIWLPKSTKFCRWLQNVIVQSHVDESNNMDNEIKDIFAGEWSRTQQLHGHSNYFCKVCCSLWLVHQIPPGASRPIENDVTIAEAMMKATKKMFDRCFPSNSIPTKSMNATHIFSCNLWSAMVGSVRVLRIPTYKQHDCFLQIVCFLVCDFCHIWGNILLNRNRHA